jgi:hypothetical protein
MKITCAIGCAVALQFRCSDNSSLSRRPAVRPVLQDPTTPTPQPLTGITQHRFSHHPLSFATTHGITPGLCLSLSPAGSQEGFPRHQHPSVEQLGGSGAPSTAGKPASTGARRGGAGGVGTGGRTTDHLGGETRRAADDDAAARRTPKVGSSPSRPRLVPPEVAAGCRGGAAPSERPPVPDPSGA